MVSGSVPGAPSFSCPLRKGWATGLIPVQVPRKSNRPMRWPFGLHGEDPNYAFGCAQRGFRAQTLLRLILGVVPAEKLLHLRSVAERFRAATFGGGKCC